MSDKSKLGTNAILNVIRQCLSVLFPLITYPYALRTLGDAGIGIVSYSQSIVSYFVLIAMLGVSNYAVREGAKLRNNKKGFGDFANEVISINILSSVLAFVLLVIAAFVIPKFQPYTYLLIVSGISIFFQSLGLEWINIVNEDYKLITIRSIIAQIISLILLFVFVHSSNDYFQYALVLIVPNALVCITNIIHCRKYFSFRFKINSNSMSHLKPMLVLFSNAVAITIYVSADMTMIGWMEGDSAAGLYTLAVKVYNIVKNLMIAVYSVAIPRLAFYYGKNEMDKFKDTLTKLWSSMTILMIPSGVGLICISPEIVNYMGGEEFVDSIAPLRFLGLALISAIFGGLMMGCINITMKREKENLMATTISAIINIVLNIFFIKWFSITGAAITTFISETFVFLFCFIRLPDKKKLLELKDVGISLFDAVIGSLLIIAVWFAGNQFISNYLVRLGFIVIVSVVLYFLFLIIRRNPVIMIVKDTLVVKGWLKNGK